MITGNKDELANPHKDCVHKLLTTLICHDNDLRRIHVDIRSLQNDFQREMEKIEFRCGELKAPPCRQTDETKDFTKHLIMLDFVNDCYKNKIDVLKNDKEAILTNARHSLKQLAEEKVKMRQFHDRTVDYLKRYAITTDDPAAIQNCERDICLMQKLMMKEVIYIKKCEAQMETFFKQIEGPATEYFSQCCFKDFVWSPSGKFDEVDRITDTIKDNMGSTLVKALANAHMLRATDIRTFLASYLKNCERNEQLLKEKLNLFGSINPLN